MNIDKSETDGSGMSANADSDTGGTSGRAKLKRFKFPIITVHSRKPWAGTLMHWDEIEYDWKGNPKRRSRGPVGVNGRRVLPKPSLADYDDGLLYGPDYNE